MLERLSLLLLLASRYCISAAVRISPDGAAVIFAVAHGDGKWSHFLHRGTPAQAQAVADEARHQAWHAEQRPRTTSAPKR